MIQILLLDDSSDKRESLKSVILPLFPQGEILIDMLYIPILLDAKLLL